eukprot:s3234_g4.t1
MGAAWLLGVLPEMWKETAEVVGPKEGDPFAGLRNFYRLLAAARRIIQRHGPAPGDLRPANCEAVDFNLGTL